MSELSKEKRRIYAREYYEQNKDEILARKKARRAANLKQEHEKERIYREKNKEKVVGWQLKHWQRKLEQLQQNNK